MKIRVDIGTSPKSVKEKNDCPPPSNSANLLKMHSFSLMRTQTM